MDKAQELRSKLAGMKVLVVGDLILDHYVFGDVSRISPEAPVPVVHARREEDTPGGAANVVKNIQSLGGRVMVAGRIGDDDDGRLLRDHFTAKMSVAEEDLFLLESPKPTTKKTRIMGNNQQICRLDWEDTRPVSKPLETDLLDRIEKTLFAGDENAPAAVIISDYGKGMITPAVMDRIRSLCRPRNIPVAVDPYTGSYDLYHRVTFLTPNHLEAAAGSGIAIEDDASLLTSGQKLYQRLEPDFLLVTRGKDGMSLFENDDRVSHYPTVARQVYDVTGAGDTVISVFTMALAAGLSLEQCCRLANLSGGQVVAKLGAVAVDLDELLASGGEFL